MDKLHPFYVIVVFCIVGSPLQKPDITHEAAAYLLVQANF